MIENESALIQEGTDGDYILKENHVGVWITVDNISLRIRRTEDGVEVEASPLNAEMDGTILLGKVTREEVEALRE